MTATKTQPTRSVIEQIAGDTYENLQERDWPSPRSANAFFWPKGVAVRGSILLFAGQIRGSDVIAKELAERAEKLARTL